MLIPVLGLLGGVTSVRTALWGIVVLVVISLLALPTRALIRRDADPSADGSARA